MSESAATRARTARPSSRRNLMIAAALVLGLSTGSTLAHAHEQRVKAEVLATAHAQAAATRSDLLVDLGAADTTLRTTLETAQGVLAGTDVAPAEAPQEEAALNNSGVGEGEIEALRQAVAQAEDLLKAPVAVTTRPEALVGAKVEVPTGTSPSVSELDTTKQALAAAVDAVAAGRVTAARDAVVAALPAAESRLASWEPIAANPDSLADLRTEVAAAIVVRDGAGSSDPVELRALADRLGAATAAHPEVISGSEGPTTIGGVPIINKALPLPSDYDPGLLPEVLGAFEQMQVAAQADGITLFIHSGYRSYLDQRITYDGWAALHGTDGADRFSSRPGHSEHQSGLSLDVNAASHTFAGTPEAAWVAANAHLFGFVVRFPDGKEAVTGYMYEPWHLRYLGVDLAQQLATSGQSLEEYLGVRADYPQGS